MSALPIDALSLAFNALKPRAPTRSRRSQRPTKSQRSRFRLLLLVAFVSLVVKVFMELHATQQASPEPLSTGSHTLDAIFSFLTSSSFALHCRSFAASAWAHCVALLPPTWREDVGQLLVSTGQKLADGPSQDESR
jgi:hypothetical protein